MDGFLGLEPQTTSFLVDGNGQMVKQAHVQNVQKICWNHHHPIHCMARFHVVSHSILLKKRQPRFSGHESCWQRTPETSGPRGHPRCKWRLTIGKKNSSITGNQKIIIFKKKMDLMFVFSLHQRERILISMNEIY